MGNQSKTVLRKFEIREGLRRKLFHLYPKTFRIFHAALMEADDISWLLQMHSIEAIMVGHQGSRTVIHCNENVSFNAVLLMQEIFDDYWACLLCMQNGFTKQAQGVMRSTVELATQLLHLKHLSSNGGLPGDSWVTGTRGIGHIRDKIADIKKADKGKWRNFATELDSLYRHLCTSTHSRKKRMSAFNFPRIGGANDMPSFEPSEIVYSRSLFASLLIKELKLIRQFLADEPPTSCRDRIASIVEEMAKKLIPMHSWMHTFDKGLLVSREHIRLPSGRQILFSMDLDRKLLYPTKRKPKFTGNEEREFQKNLTKRMIQDLV